MQRLNAAGVPCGPVYDIGQAFEDAQARHLRMTRPAPHAALGDVQLLRSPINLSACPHPEHFERAAPDAGEHTDQVLSELGYDAEAVARMRGAGNRGFHYDPFSLSPFWVTPPAPPPDERRERAADRSLTLPSA